MSCEEGKVTQMYSFEDSFYANCSLCGFQASGQHLRKHKLLQAEAPLENEHVIASIREWAGELSLLCDLEVHTELSPQVRTPTFAIHAYLRCLTPDWSYRYFDLFRMGLVYDNILDTSIAYTHELIPEPLPKTETGLQEFLYETAHDILEMDDEDIWWRTLPRWRVR